MPGLFHNKYRIDTIRLPDFDYGDDGAYFVTICTVGRKIFFGSIKNEKMILNGVGQIVNDFWLQIPSHFSNVILDEYVIMPNHVHGIIEIRHSCFRRDEALPRLYKGTNPIMSKISPNPQSLPVIIGSFKSICTKIINQKYPSFGFFWQPRYHDHFIRNYESLANIQNYILDNPYNWSRDRNNPLNIAKFGVK